MLLAQPAVELHWLRVGHCLQYAALAVQGQPWRRTEFPSYAALLRPPGRGWVLVDTGYADRFFSATARLPERLYRVALPVVLPEDERLPYQLDERGVAPSDVETVVVTHFHGDHVAGLVDYPRAQVVAGAAGLTQLRALGRVAATRHGLLPGLLPDDVDRRFVAAESLALVDPGLVAPGGPGLVGRDLFGDASVVLIDLPGHLPGHLGVLVTATDGRQVLLSGDAAWSWRSISERTPPAWVAQQALADPATARRTLDSLHALTLGHPGLLVLPSHCEASARRWRDG